MCLSWRAQIGLATSFHQGQLIKGTLEPMKLPWPWWQSSQQTNRQKPVWQTQERHSLHLLKYFIFLPAESWTSTLGSISVDLSDLRNRDSTPALARTARTGVLVC